MQDALVKNAADKKQVDSARVHQNFERRTELDDMKFILSDLRGRRFLWRLLAKCGLYQLSFSGNAERTAFNEGSRNIGLFISHEMIEADSSAWLTMMAENNKGDRKNGK